MRMKKTIMNGGTSMKKEEDITRVTIRVPSQLYAEYKKSLIDKRTKTTYDLLQHIRESVEEYQKEDVHE